MITDDVAALAPQVESGGSDSEGETPEYEVPSETEDYENTVQLHNGEYVAVAELEEVFGAVATWSKGVPIKTPSQLQRHDIEALHNIVRIYVEKAKKHEQQRKKLEESQDKAPELPPKGATAQPPERPPKEARRPKRSRRSRGNRRSRDRLQQQGDEGERYRPSLLKGP